MLPKIPYSMDKNKSMTIPIGNYNISSNFKPGDIADSYGISARKFPRLTTRKGRALIYTGGEILGMTVFNGEIVTVRSTSNGDAAIFVADTQIGELSGNYKRTLAAINTKLVVYPDKMYIEKTLNEEGNTDWMSKRLEERVVAAENECIFSKNSLTIAKSATLCSGYGLSVHDDELSGNIALVKETSGTFLYRIHGGYNNGYGNTLDIVSVEKFSSWITVDYHTIRISWSVEDKKIVATAEDVPDSYYSKLVHTELASTMFFVTTSGKVYRVSQTKATQSSAGSVGGTTFYNVTIEFEAENGSDDIQNNSLSETYQIYREIDKNDIVANLPSSRFAYVYLNDIDSNLASGYSHNKTEVSFELYNDRECKVGISTQIRFEFRGWMQSDIEKIRENNMVVIVGYPDNYMTVNKVSIDKSDSSFKITFKEGSGLDGNWSGALKKSLTIYSQGPDIAQMFKKGDAVDVSGSSVTSAGVSNDISFIIFDVKGSTIYAGTDIFTGGESTTPVTVERKIPDLDFICEKDNRLYGVNNSEKNIYVSALGDPTNMYAYEGVSTDSFAVAVGGEGNFTGCCKYAESVLFFKEDKIYKLVGSYPAEFALYSYDVDGLESGSEKSPAVINEVLYYKGKNGVFAYTGGIPSLISDNFGEKIFSNAVGGSDSICYYLAAKDEKGTNKLLSFNTRLGLWVLENDGGDEIIDFAKTSSGLHYATSDGEVYKLHGSENVAENWMVQFVPFYETIEGKKTYSRLLMRAELPKGSYMIIEVRSDDGPWCEAGKIVGANKGIIPIRLPIARCDKFEIRLRGKGEFVLHDILREYHVGSEV